MPVELRFFGTIRAAVGTKTITRELARDATVRDVLAGVESDYPELEGRLLDEDEVADGITVLHNGTNVVNRAGAGTAVTDGDQVAVTLPVTGGCPGDAGETL